jgi:hypothetical protein
MKWETIKINRIKANKDNPRVIKDKAFKRLVRSVKEFPEMLNIRPIVVDRDYMVLGGNQRLKACKEAGFKVVPIVYADDLTEEQKQEFIIKDNVSAGEWDNIKIGKNWNKETIKEWGLDIEIKEEIEAYSRKIKTPHYEIKGNSPDINSLIDTKVYLEKIKRIESSKVDESIKDFLRFCAGRYVEIDFEKVAEFYANSSKEVQELFEDQVLVIIDFKSAILNGFVQMSESISDQFQDENGV